MTRVKRPNRIALALALALPFASAVACAQLLSIDGPIVVDAPHDAATVEAGSDLEAGGGCGLGLPAGECSACIAANCCPQETACATNPSCAVYERCLESCAADYACRATCLIDHPIGNILEVPALDQCVAAQCYAPCGITCGVTEPYAEPDSAAACQQCVVANDCTVAEGCGKDLECQRVSRCTKSCRTRTCQFECGESLEAGASRFLPLLFGMAGSCLWQCSFGAYWECVGKVVWPLAESDALNVRLVLRDAGSHAALPNVVVRACHGADTSCASPVAVATSDSGGIADLTIHLPDIGGFSGFFSLDPDPTAEAGASSDLMPYLFFPSAPISEKNAIFDNFLMLTKTEFQNMASLVSIGLDPQRGHIAVLAADCYVNNAPDVVISAAPIDGQTQERYLSGGGVALSNTATATDSSGYAFFFNVKSVGTIDVTATPHALGHASSHTPIFVQPGALSVVTALPTP